MNRKSMNILILKQAKDGDMSQEKSKIDTQMRLLKYNEFYAQNSCTLIWLKNQITVYLETPDNGDERGEEQRHNDENASSITEEHQALPRENWHFHQDHMDRDSVRSIKSFERSILQ